MLLICAEAASEWALAAPVAQEEGRESAKPFPTWCVEVLIK